MLTNNSSSFLCEIYRLIALSTWVFARVIITYEHLKSMCPGELNKVKHDFPCVFITFRVYKCVGLVSVLENWNVYAFVWMPFWGISEINLSHETTVLLAYSVERLQGIIRQFDRACEGRKMAVNVDKSAANLFAHLNFALRFVAMHIFLPYKVYLFTSKHLEQLL